MTQATRAYAAFAADKPLAPFEFVRRDLRSDDIAIEILYCGVCHSDLHIAHNDWGFSRYPVVPGHEIVGRVTAVGSEVTRFKAGDMVGVGCMVDACGHCGPCNHGEEQYCAEYNTPTYGGIDRRDGQPTHGGYSERITVTEKFVLRIPAKLDPKSAAPLLCAGITTYSPLRHWRIGKGHKVAVVGLGGLGHMALKFAKALGAEVTLFTRSPDKETEARRLGADHVVLSTDTEQMNAARGSYDFILDTVPTEHDLNPYLWTLKIDGTLVLLGLIGVVQPPLQTLPLVFGRRQIAGSLIGGIAETQEMLDFCAEHGITCDVEMIDMQYINTAYERMLKSDVHYRFVIDLASLKNA